MQAAANARAEQSTSARGWRRVGALAMCALGLAVVPSAMAAPREPSRAQVIANAVKVATVYPEYTNVVELDAAAGWAAWITTSYEGGHHHHQDRLVARGPGGAKYETSLGAGRRLSNLRVAMVTAPGSSARPMAVVRECARGGHCEQWAIDLRAGRATRPAWAQRIGNDALHGSWSLHLDRPSKDSCRFTVQLRSLVGRPTRRLPAMPVAQNRKNLRCAVEQTKLVGTAFALSVYVSTDDDGDAGGTDFTQLLDRRTGQWMEFYTGYTGGTFSQNPTTFALDDQHLTFEFGTTDDPPVQSWRIATRAPSAYPGRKLYELTGRPGLIGWRRGLIKTVTACRVASDGTRLWAVMDRDYAADNASCRRPYGDGNEGSVVVPLAQLSWTERAAPPRRRG